MLAKSKLNFQAQKEEVQLLWCIIQLTAAGAWNAKSPVKRSHESSCSTKMPVLVWEVRSFSQLWFCKFHQCEIWWSASMEQWRCHVQVQLEQGTCLRRMRGHVGSPAQPGCWALGVDGAFSALMWGCCMSRTCGVGSGHFFFFNVLENCQS